MTEEVHAPVILLVDDNAELLKTQELFLTDQKHTVVAVSSFSEAVKAVHKMKPTDLIVAFIDLHLGQEGNGGHELLKYLRENLRHRAISFVLTGSPDPYVRRAAVDLGAIACLTKPVHLIEIEGYASQSAETIRRLITSSRLDGLTGILNHATFKDEVEREINVARSGLVTPPEKHTRARVKVPECFSLILIDVDDFKRLNEEHNYTVGDRVLMAIGKSMKSGHIRPSDYAARWGGDEFVALLPHAKLEIAEHVTKRLQDTIHASEVTDREGKPVRFTVSFGVSHIRTKDMRGTNMEVLAELVIQAQKNLKKMKELKEEPRRD